MALTPMIIVGCGGSGGKVIVGLRQRLEVELRRSGWTEGIPEAWQMLYVDTPGSQETNLDYGMPVPESDYISTAARQNSYAPVDEAVSNHAQRHGALDRLSGWRPAHDLPVPVSDGAGQWRAVGRMVAFNGLGDVADRFKRAISSCRSGQAQLQRLGADHLGDPTMPSTTPFVVVVSSMAGGTGAGIFIDVCDVVRTVEPELNDRIMSVLFTAEVFQNINGGAGLQPNTVGVLGELMSGYFDRNRAVEPLYAGVVPMQQQEMMSSGPSYPFVVGMQTMAGQPLTDISQSYKAVTETLSAAMLSSEVYKDLLEFQITNWSNNALPNMTAWDFGNPSFAGGTARRSGGMVSSFGSSRLSVGSVLFGEYATFRLTREIFEFLIGGFLTEGRQLLQDSTATQDEVLEYFRAERGLQFVYDCHLHELNDSEEEHNQVLDAVLPPEDINTMMRGWWRSLVDELTQLGEHPKGHWMQAIRDLVPNRLAQVTNPATQQIDRQISVLAEELPRRVVSETSRIMSELGVPVARQLVAYAEQQVSASVTQLKYEAAQERQLGEAWLENAGQALSGLAPRDKVPAGHAFVGGDNGAIKKATARGYREVRALSRERTADFLERFSKQVLKPLIAQLEQMIHVLADPDIQSDISKLPAQTGVPARFAPTPFDYCLIDVEDWPKHYDDLVRETAEQESDPDFAADSADATVRRMVGGGGFLVTKEGRPQRVPAALEVVGSWSMDRALRFDTALKISDLTSRVREWINRSDMAIGSFIDQDLDTYLKATGPDGSPQILHKIRLDKFQDKLSAALKAATPLVSIDQNVFARVHPRSSMGSSMTNLDVQSLPVTGPARETAEKVLAPYAEEHKTKELRDFFTDGTSGAESVLIVSQLAGAVHPSAVMSLTQPISSAWDRARTSTATMDAFWQYRRARTLPESVPVAPKVLDDMIKGWFIGRAFGAIPNPTESAGFRIGGKDGEQSFPWPLLRCGNLGEDLADVTHQLEWLPAILESLGLAYMLVPTEPGILNAYDALYDLGSRAQPVMGDWFKSGVYRHALVEPRVAHAGTPEASFDSLHDTFVDTRNVFQNRIDEAVLAAEPDEFFRLEFGYTLFPKIVAALGDLIKDLPRPTSVEMKL